MKFTFEAKSIAKCSDFLELIYEGERYSLQAFSEKYKKSMFDLDRMLPSCSFVYRGKLISFEEYKNARLQLSEQLPFFRRYHEEIFPLEIGLAISSPAYYKASKFLEKAENCLQTARYYFLESTNILEFDCRLNWKAGYAAIYDVRSMDFSTAIIWYNNCFDYIIQVAFLAFELYKGTKKYSETMLFEDILKICSYNTLKMFHDNNPDNSGLNDLWNIIETCRIGRQKLNDWANYSKHKGGLGFVGLKPELPYAIFIRSPNGEIEPRTSELDAVTIDLDESIEDVVKAHNALINCMNSLIDLIGFDKAIHTIDAEGRFVIPDKKDYCKVTLKT